MGSGEENSAVATEEGVQRMEVESAGYVTLIIRNQQEEETQCIRTKIKKSTPLQKLMDAYCNRKGLQASQFRFMVDQEQVASEDTAEKLGLVDEDVIDVVGWATAFARAMVGHG